MISGHFVRAVAQLLHMAINLYIIIIIVRSVISWMGTPPPNAFIMILRKLTDPVFRFVHRTLPFTIVGGIDISPIIILVVLYFIDSFLYGVLMNYAAKMLAGG